MKEDWEKNWEEDEENNPFKDIRYGKLRCILAIIVLCIIRIIIEVGFAFAQAPKPTKQELEAYEEAFIQQMIEEYGEPD